MDEALIARLKILDSVCGSGAFPMLACASALWAISSRPSALTNWTYGSKLYLMENGIYGVDIQPIAVQLAKLRFFISMVVEQKINPPSPEDPHE